MVGGFQGKDRRASHRVWSRRLGGGGGARGEGIGGGCEMGEIGQSQVAL